MFKTYNNNTQWGCLKPESPLMASRGLYWLQKGSQCKDIQEKTTSIPTWFIISDLAEDNVDNGEMTQTCEEFKWRDVAKVNGSINIFKKRSSSMAHSGDSDELISTSTGTSQLRTTVIVHVLHSITTRGNNELIPYQNTNSLGDQWNIASSVLVWVSVSH